MSATKYVLELYAPDGHDPIASIESPTPFGAISKGDFLAGLSLFDESVADHYRVKSVRHLLTNSEGRPVRHQIMIHTEEVSEEDLRNSY